LPFVIAKYLEGHVIARAKGLKSPCCAITTWHRQSEKEAIVSLLEYHGIVGGERLKKI
jgi:hypothetical protein